MKIVPIAGRVPVTGDLQPGCQGVYIIRLGDAQQGNWGYLDLPRCTEGPCASLSGSAALECEIAFGHACWLDRGYLVSTLPGARQGALRDGMLSRFRNDTDQRRGICYGAYLGNGNRVIVIPLTRDLTNGHHVVELAGLAAFFLRELPANDDNAVEAEFLHYVVAP